MRRTDTFRVQKCTGKGGIGVACRLAIFLPGVMWSNLNIAATELSVIYDDRRIMLPDIISALNNIGVAILFLPSPSKSPAATIPAKRTVRYLHSYKEANKFTKDREIQVSGMPHSPYKKIL
jgi:hypothetical protein